MKPRNLSLLLLSLLLGSACGENDLPGDGKAKEDSDSLGGSGGLNSDIDLNSGGALSSGGGILNSTGGQSLAGDGGLSSGGGENTSGGGAPSAGGDTASGGGNEEEPVAHCSPGTEERVYTSQGLGDLGAYCPQASALKLPNPTNARRVEGILLPEPMTGGESYALSFSERGTSNRSIEIWGTNEECGVAEEALWWGYLGVGTRCAEFTPSSDYSHILIVDRSHDGETSIANLTIFNFCSTGTCPEGTNGNSLGPGGPLLPETGAYPVTSSSLYKGHNWGVGPEGTMKLFYEGSSDEEVPHAIDDGYFRMTPVDPFGDAWYCVGEGSTVTEYEDYYEFDFKNITKLGDCSDVSGTGTAEVTHGPDINATISSFPFLEEPDHSEYQFCKNWYCSFSIFEVPKVSWVEVLTSVDVGIFNNPTLEKADLLRAAWFLQLDDGEPIQMSCAGSGTLDFDPDNTTTLSLSGMSDFVSCPGTPIENNEFSGRVD